MKKNRTVTIAVVVLCIIVSLASFIILKNPDEVNSYTWASDEIEYNIVLNEIPQNVSNINEGRIPLGSDEHKVEMFSDVIFYKYGYESSCIHQLSDVLQNLYTGTTEHGYTRFVLDFVRGSISYSSDLKIFHMPDWIAYPEETLYNRAGDCEDIMILFASIMQESGYDCGIAMFPGHVVAMIGLDDYELTVSEFYSQSYVERDGKTYYACDPTRDVNCGVGYNDDVYNSNNIRYFNTISMP